MTIDLTSHAGFPLSFDPDALEITAAAGIRFRRQARRVEELRDVLYRPDALPPQTDLYWNYTLDHAGAADPFFQRYHLTLGLVLLPARTVGSEFVKTHGHYHSAMPGSQIGYPEVYTHYSGTLYLFMQKRVSGLDAHLEDCVLYEMQPGQSIMVPPGYAHILINPSDQPALMAGLYSLDAVHDYRPIRELSGAAYFFIQEDSAVQTVINPRYATVPGLRRLHELTGTPFAPPDPHRPLWTSFVVDPQSYEFMIDPAAARDMFRLEEPAL